MAVLTAAERIAAANEARPGDFPGGRSPHALAIDNALTPVARRTTWTAAELLAAKFPAPRYAVPGVLPEGLTLLAGAPKIGKSFLALNIACAVALGGKALGRVQVEGGDVIYLALEDTARRLQDRLRIMLQGEPAPGRLLLATQWPAMDNGGIEQLDNALTARPDRRLVVVDVLAKVRPRSDPRASVYDADYAVIGALKALADRHSVAVLVLTHLRKADAGDVLSTITGSTGIPGAADTAIVMRRVRGAADASLVITGRDIGDAELAMRWEPSCAAWTLLDGPAEDYALDGTRRRVLALARERGSVRAADVATELGIDAAAARQTLRRMAEDGQLDQAERGLYLPPAPVTTVTLSRPEGDGHDRERDDVTDVTALPWGEEL